MVNGREEEGTPHTARMLSLVTQNSTQDKSLPLMLGCGALCSLTTT